MSLSSLCGKGVAQMWSVLIDMLVLLWHLSAALEYEALTFIKYETAFNVKGEIAKY